MTVLELIVVIAIIGMSMFLVRSGFRALTKADLVDNATELSAVLRRTSQLAIENGELHRVVIDLDRPNPEAETRYDYVVEVCRGQTAIMRNEALNHDEEAAKRALERGKQRFDQMPADALAVGDPDEAMKRTAAVAGQHIADRQCTTASEGFTGDSTGKKWGRALKIREGVVFKQVWIQHLADKATKGQVAIYFFPNGRAEKAVIELTDGSDVYTVLVHGLTGRVELRDGALKDPEAHMLRNALGDREAPREDQ